jgi:hypothetical protein
MISTVLPLLDAGISLAAAGACVSGFIVLIGLAAPSRYRPQQARSRRRWYRDQLKRGRVTYQDTPEDEQLKALIHYRNLRQSRRERVFLAARVTLAGSPSGLDCTIIDISNTGARLAFGHVVNLPRQIELEIRGNRRRVRADVVWFKDNACGIHFVADLTLDQPLELAGPALARSTA